MFRILTYTLFLAVIYDCFVDGFNLTLLHTNDVHAHIEQFNRFGSTCSSEDALAGECFGGVARVATKVKDIRNSHPNTLLVDAGDEFVGTLWYTYYKGNASAHFMNLIGYDVMCLGNHEFDDGLTTLNNFIANLTFPVVSSNTGVNSGSPLQGKFNKSTVVNVGGERIGIIGYITPDTAFISNGGRLVTFSDILIDVTSEVASLTSKGINKIIALGHAGYQTDLLVANIEGVDIVVGGHTNTFLYNGDQPSNDDIDGAYPTVVTQPSGNKALVVQDFTWAKYLGYLNVTFDVNGDVMGYAGNPIMLDGSIQEDPTVLQAVNQWGAPLDELSNQVVGSSKLNIDGSRQNCRVRECLMGNLLTDAMVDYHLTFSHSNTSWAPAAIAVWNGGGIRASIDKGPVTLGEVLTAVPFGNEVDLIRITGTNLRAQLKHSVSAWEPFDPSGRFLQVAGLRVTYLTDEKDVYDVMVRCLECESPSYAPLRDDEEYNVFVSSFLIDGGDGYQFQPLKRERFNSIDSSLLAAYFRKHDPTFTELTGRIVLKTRDDISAASLPTIGVSLIISLLTIAFSNIV